MEEEVREEPNVESEVMEAELPRHHIWVPSNEVEVAGDGSGLQEAVGSIEKFAEEIEMLADHVTEMQYKMNAYIEKMLKEYSK